MTDHTPKSDPNLNQMGPGVTQNNETIILKDYSIGVLNGAFLTMLPIKGLALNYVYSELEMQDWEIEPKLKDSESQLRNVHFAMRRIW